MRLARPIYRQLRTKYLQWRYPQGGYVLGNGIRVFCNFAHPSYMWYDADSPNLAFDQQVIRAVIAQSEGDVFIDVGAHFGFFSAYLGELLSHRSAPSKIIALEPDKEHFRCLKETVRPYVNQNVILLPFAISDSEGHVTLYKSDAPCLHSYKEANAVSCYQVKAISLDSIARLYTNEEEKIAFIKIDVDGAEPLLFAGGKEAISKHKPIMLMEFAPDGLRQAGVEPQEFFNQLCHNFCVYWLSYESWTIRRIGCKDYEEMVKSVGNRITDLLLSSASLSFPAPLAEKRQ